MGATPPRWAPRFSIVPSTTRAHARNKPKTQATSPHLRPSRTPSPGSAPAARKTTENHFHLHLINDYDCQGYINFISRCAHRAQGEWERWRTPCPRLSINRSARSKYRSPVRHPPVHALDSIIIQAQAPTPSGGRERPFKVHRVYFARILPDFARLDRQGTSTLDLGLS